MASAAPKAAPRAEAPAAKDTAMGAIERERALDICRKWDSDGDGAISQTELRQALQAIFPDCSNEDADNLLQSVDLNRDGIIQYEEFFSWICQPSSEKLSFEDHLKSYVFADPASLERSTGITGDLPPAGVEDDITEESQPKLTKGMSLISSGTDSASPGSTESTSPGTERRRTASEFLEAFTHTLIARFKVVGEKEASTSASASIIAVEVDQSSLSPTRRRPTSAGSGGIWERPETPTKSCAEALAVLHRGADGQLTIRVMALTVSPTSGDEKLLLILENLATAYQRILEVFCSELQQAKGAVSNPVLRLEPLPIFDQESLRPFKHAYSADIAFSSIALAITRLGGATQRQLACVQVELFFPGAMSQYVPSFQEVFASKTSIAAAPVRINSLAGRLSSERGNYDWIRKDNAPKARLYRLQSFILTQRAIQAGGYDLPSVDGKTVKKVELPKVKEMLRGTKVHMQDAAALHVASPGHKTELAAPEELGLSEEATVMDVAKKLAEKGHRVAAVSAASAYHAGGGVSTGGRHALEEAWCTMTTLYQSLHAVDAGAATDELADGPEQHIPTLGCIVSPEVEMFREPSSEGYGFLAEPVCLSGLLSVAMFNRNPSVSDSPLDSPDDPAKYIEQTTAKLEAVVTAAINLQAEVLIMPDVGCGVFQNDPLVIGGCLGMTLRKYHGYLLKVVVMGTQKFKGACRRTLRGGDPRELCPKGKCCTDVADISHNARLAHPWREIAEESADGVRKVMLGLVAYPEEIAKPECRYGMYCRIRTPQHLARFSHPEVAARPPSAGGRPPAAPPTGAEFMGHVRKPPSDHLTRPDSRGAIGRSTSTSSGMPSPGAIGRSTSTSSGTLSRARREPSGGVSREDMRDNPDLSASTASTNPGRTVCKTVSRPVCKYGEGCYNKNPQHLADFAHPWLTGGESAEEASRRKDEQASHELLNVAKDGRQWPTVIAKLRTQPHLINFRPESRNFGLIHYACFQIQSATIESLIVEFAADANLRTRDGQTPVEVLTESLAASPSKNPTDKAKDEELLRWLRKRAAGDSSSGLGAGQTSDSGTGPAPAAPPARTAAAAAAKDGRPASGTRTAAGRAASRTRTLPGEAAPAATGTGMHLQVVHCMNPDLDGEYEKLPDNHNGYPAYRKASSSKCPTTCYLYFNSDSRRGWVIDKDLDDSMTPLAYLGPSMCRSDPSAKSYGENWKVYRLSSVPGIGGFHDPDREMKIMKKTLTST